MQEDKSGWVGGRYLIPDTCSKYRNENNKDLPCDLRHHHYNSNKLNDEKCHSAHLLRNVGVHFALIS
jgi:hypothetical protein